VDAWFSDWQRKQAGAINRACTVLERTMQAITEDLLKTATQKLVTEFQPEQIWLFGSHAWGNPHDNSDVDLFVIVRDSDETPIRRAQRAHRCLRGLRMPKDVLVETRQEVDRVKGVKTSLESFILSRGRRLYG
jgi:predicted nucleotidyltransferase